MVSRNQGGIPRILKFKGHRRAVSGSGAGRGRRRVRPCLERLDDRLLLSVNPIVTENSLPGTPQSQWLVQGDGDPTLQGFTTDISVNHGQTVNFKINDTASALYHIDIYRMGYYGGNGARLVTTISSTQTLDVKQPAPLTDSSTGLIDAGNWSVTTSWAVPASATSGIYFADLVRQDTGGASMVFFVVRADESHSNILFQTSDSTWEAYNYWGGNTLYYGNFSGTANASMGAGRSYAVSYNRPLTLDGTTGGYGSYNSPLHGEFSMDYWLEENGYDVSYFTDVDSDRNGSLILNHQVFMSVGHDEYVSGQQRANEQAALAAGVNLAFVSGNEVYWKTRWATSLDASKTAYRSLVCYKESWAHAVIDPLDPPTATSTWRDPQFASGGAGLPENALSGTMYMNDRTSTDLGIPLTVPSTYSQLRFWRNTSVANLQSGQTATLGQYIVGYETDEDVDNGFRPAGLFDMSSTTFSTSSHVLDSSGTVTGQGTSTHSITLYRAPSGALVFGAGTVQWDWGLANPLIDGTGSAVVPAIQQATVNLLADMGVQPSTLQAGLVAASKSADTTPPTSTITSPAGGASIQSGSTVTITGTAIDSGGGVVAAVEVSVDGGNTWHRATGQSAWSYTWAPNGLGSLTIKSRAVDDSGNLETPSAGTTVTVAGPISLWSKLAQPMIAADGDSSSTEVGVKFRSDVSAYILGLRFYKGSTNTGTHVGSLWSSTGTLLAQATFTNETASGWQQVNFASPVAIQPNTTYVASYHAPNGHYAEDDSYFASSGVSNGPLHALAAGVDGPDGVYAYGSTSLFPTNNYQSANYWVDVVYNTTATDTTPPTVTAETPAPNATGVAPSTTVTATFSESIQSSTLSFVLKDSGGNVVPTTVIYTDSKLTATLMPSSSLANSTTYTATVSGAKDQAGNTMSPVTWSFTTAAPLGPGPYSIWPSTAAPVTASDPDTSSTELGVKFRSDVGGYITGLSFYKGSTNTGTHVGSLWSSTGTLLAQATFTNETASGWQQVNFASPVAIQPNTTYVASYHAPNGHYAEDDSYFASSGVDNTPLHALAAGVDGPDGVYINSTSSAFPTNTYLSANYWVDVVFNTTLTDTTPPTVTGQTPAPNASGVSTATTVTATFSEAVQSGTVTTATFTLAGPSGNVAATVSYNPTNFVATLTPSTTLAANTTYTAMVSGVKDLAGNVMNPPPITWSFTTGAPDTTPPTVTGQTPVPNASGVSTATTVTATFSEAVDPSTVTSTTCTLAGPSGNVAATVSYNSTTFVATLTPSATLAANTTYTATVSGVKDLAGNVMNPPPVIWSFTTASIGPGPFSIWSPSVAPVTATDPDTSAIEVGVKFRSDVAGYVTAIRFYKGSTNTGTHVGSLWTSTGTLLAQATFTSETATGWQQVTFASPVAINANTTYVASYHTNVGHYAEDDNYFASSGVTNGPLHALAAGVDGPDGVYAYGASSTFPTNNYLSANYWVDVVFSQNVWLQTTAADFSAGSQNGTVVTNNSGGEVQLAPSFSDDFTGTSLSSNWTSTAWPGVTPHVTVSGGILSVAGAQVRSVPTVPSGTPVEGKVTIAAAANQQFGLANDLSATSGNSWAIFRTKSATNTLYAEVNSVGVVTSVSLGSRPTGYHVYRVQPTATGFQFYIDGVLKTTINKTIPSGTGLTIDLASANSTALTADWIRMVSYPSGGTFTSSVLDAGRTVTWGNASWTASLPAGTSFVIETISSTDGNTWSDWSAVGSNGAITSPSGRYLRYRIRFTTTDPTQTATLNDISFTWN